ncbi:unnamed protein product [Cuscuta campestris]|uniref:Uncharacterized protein n=1 Tax=Cuscuta campestris TaxID=132261 RepID=A0A484NJN6_9ASTE|nr:unnamed protein product [Cuscuta campestris]
MADILEELLSSAEYVNDKKQSVDILIDRIRNPKDWDTRMSPSERFEVLSTISHFALTLSSMPPKYGILGESYYWSAGYQLNIRIYEKLLVGLFDILEDDHLIEEAGEILNLLKSSWSMLGITQKLHNVIHAWVLFQQKPSLLNEVMSMALMVGAYSFESCDKNKFTGFEALDSTRYRKVKDYVESSIEAVSKRVTDSIGHGHRIDKTHPLTVLASELKFISEKEMAVFYPILQQFCPEVGIVSALKLHKIYGERLGPFLNDVSCLSEGVREVLTAAVLLEDCLFELYSLGKRQSAHYSARTNEFEYYKVRLSWKPLSILGKYLL